MTHRAVESHVCIKRFYSEYKTQLHIKDAPQAPCIAIRTAWALRLLKASVWQSQKWYVNDPKGVESDASLTTCTCARTNSNTYDCTWTSEEMLRRKLVVIESSRNSCTGAERLSQCNGRQRCVMRDNVLRSFWQPLLCLRCSRPVVPKLHGYCDTQWNRKPTSWWRG